MATGRDQTRPRTFFLNETHELSPLDKPGGGQIPKYADIPWARKARRISSSIDQVLKEVKASRDPLREERYFVVAKPERELKKRSDDVRKAPHGTFSEPTSYGGAHGRVFDRLGLDLLQVTNDGKAVVHGAKERVEQLLQRSKALESLGAREQSRWATIEAFETVPLQLRLDSEWLDTLKPDQPAEVVFELQPILGRVDADRVLRAIADLLRKAGERVVGTGIDFSGRFWFRGRAVQSSIKDIARDFFSVQAIHSPLYSFALATRSGGRSQTATRPPPVDARSLPCVAVVDLGVPADHIQLGPYRRGQFVPQDAVASLGIDHGSFVASRVVFGDALSAEDLSNAAGRCSFYDAVVGDGYENRISDKAVLPAIQGVRGAAPDVRVFNLSFGDTQPLGRVRDVDRREKRLMMQDLDNFVFANDVVVVVAAGNSQQGLAPTVAYPGHYGDPAWALGSWACGFNTMVCGSFVSQVSSNGLVQTVGWPSAFSRVGPGICDSPVPSFGAEGGNSDATYNAGPSLGVWGFSGQGLVEDRMGTSHAAPILAREAAISLAALQDFCAVGSVPFGVTARAFLAMTAEKTTTDLAVSELAGRTLGFGKASSRRIGSPVRGSAVILWQGIIESASDIVRVQIPIPSDWLAEATSPVLRMCVCYDPPVNEAASALWTCRRVNVTLHPGPEANGLKGRRDHATYPLFFREYKLGRYAPGTDKAAEGDLWVLEFSYEETFDYPPGMDFDPRQRVAFAAELIDRDSHPVDPQRSMQALPIAASMNRLSVQRTPVRTPVIVKTRGR